MDKTLEQAFMSGFATVTFIVLAIISILKFDKVDMTAMYSLMWRTIPATVVMGLLGKWMGSILDRPKNIADSDYTIDVLKALKQLDKNMTMADLNEKLSPIQELPDDIQMQIDAIENGEANDEPST